MSTSQYLLGAAELAVIAAALGLGAYHVRALLVPSWTGALARLAEVVLGLSALIVVSEILGVLSLFKELPLVLGCVAAGLGALQLSGLATQLGRCCTAGQIASTAEILRQMEQSIADLQSEAAVFLNS